jgi:hypothetical protein
MVLEMFDVLGLSLEVDCSDLTSKVHVISRAALEGSVTPKTVRLLGKIKTKQVLILIDSGSSHSFISEELAAILQGVHATKTPLKVRIADVGGGGVR